MSKVDYKSAGVDVDAGNLTVDKIKQDVQSTFTNRVVGDLGHFAGLYDVSFLKHFQNPLLAHSIDGLGTKTIVAKMAGFYDNLGHDLLAATANDILVMGAKAMTMMDYIAVDKLNPDTVAAIVKSLSAACREHEVVLIGGETAEMPDTYQMGEHDVVGAVIGVVEKDNIIDGSKVSEGDVLYGFSSSGLHTNGYSLARKLFFDVGKYQIDSHVPELNQTVVDALLAPHINYEKPVFACLEKVDVHGMCHITGGGLLENLKRILPAGLSAEVHLSQCPEVPLFELMRDLGKLENHDLHQTFNMGIGWVIAAPASSSTQIHTIGKAHNLTVYEVGHIVAGNGGINLY